MSAYRQVQRGLGLFALMQAVALVGPDRLSLGLSAASAALLGLLLALHVRVLPPSGARVLLIGAGLALVGLAGAEGAMAVDRLPWWEALEPRQQRRLRAAMLLLSPLDVAGLAILARIASARPGDRLPEHPGLLGLLGHRGLRDLLRPLPFLPMRSDVVDVVYLNWLVPAEGLRPLLPPPLRLRTLGDGDLAAITVLTYRHGHFGPRFLGPLRWLMPSPVQSNWRLYLQDSDDVYFLHSLLGSTAMALGARLLSDGLPATARPDMQLERVGGHTVIVGGRPDLFATVAEGERELPADWAALFGDWTEAVRAMTTAGGAQDVDPVWGAVFRAAIDLRIAPASVQPGKVVAWQSLALRRIVGEAEPFAFVVPSVRFDALRVTASRTPR